MKNIDKIKLMNKSELVCLLDSNRCRMCEYSHARTITGCCDGDCAEGIGLWLEKEIEITDEDIDWEYKQFCDGHCTVCRYNDSDGRCKFRWFVDNFNVNDGKITRR